MRVLPEREEGGLHGPMFIGLATLVSNGMTAMVPAAVGSKGGSATAAGIFETRHTPDFKFLETDLW